MAVLRRDLGGALLQGAMAAGASVEEGVLVRGPLMETGARDARVRGVVLAGRDGGDLRVPAPLVIPADGRPSPLPLPLRLPRHPPRPPRRAVGPHLADAPP